MMQGTEHAADRHAVARDDTDSANVTTTVIEAVEDVIGESELMAQRPLFHTIDPDALDRLFEPVGSSTGIPVTVRFEYAGCRIEVASSGRVAVVERRSDREPDAQ